MQRRYTPKHLSDLGGIVQNYRAQVRMLFKIHQADLKTLDSVESKQKYKPEHLTRQKIELRQAALRNLRTLGAEMLKTVKPALAEKGLHSRQYYLQDGFYDEQPDLRHLNEERQATLQALADVSVAVRQLAYVTRLARMDDDALTTMCEQAVTAGDRVVAGLALEEASLRKNSLLALKVQGLVDQLEIPEARVAEEFFSLTKDVIAEFASLEQLIEDPSNMIAHAGIHSREINEETAARRQAEEAAEQQARKEAQERAEAERKAALEEFMKKAPEPAAA